MTLSAQRPGEGLRPGEAQRTGDVEQPVETPRSRDTEGMAVASFIFGLMGLLVGNLILGPTAIVLAVLALRGGTARRGRAWAGVALGFADLAVIAVLTVVDGTVSWSL